ncbi:MAG: hypothetical protein ABIB79_03455 [archaeon]
MKGGINKMWDTLIEDSDKFSKPKYESPEQFRELFKTMQIFTRKYREVQCNLNYLRFGQTTPSQVISSLIKLSLLNNEIVIEFLSLFRKTAEELEVKDQEILEDVEEDVTNVMIFIQDEQRQILIGPNEKKNHDSLSYLLTNYSLLFNSLIGKSLVNAHKLSRKARPKIEHHLSGRAYECGVEYYTKDELFKKEFYESVKSMRRGFKKQLMILSRGKIPFQRPKEEIRALQEINRGIQQQIKQQNQEEEPLPQSMEFEEELDADEEI